jgi:hypothetical protein
MLNQVQGNQPMNFKGCYKVTMPNVKTLQDPKEKSAMTEVVMNTVVMGANMSVAAPRMNKEAGSVYFKIADKKDGDFEKGFNMIIDGCNKKFGVDAAKKAYIQKVSEEEFNKMPQLQ